MAILTLEAAERNRDTEFWPYQSLRVLSPDVFLRPGVRLPSIFPPITSCRRRYFPLRIIWPKYSSLRRLISKSTSVSLLIRFKTATLLRHLVHTRHLNSWDTRFFVYLVCAVPSMAGPKWLQRAQDKEVRQSLRETFAQEWTGIGWKKKKQRNKKYLNCWI